MPVASVKDKQSVNNILASAASKVQLGPKEVPNEPFESDGLLVDLPAEAHMMPQVVPSPSAPSPPQV